MTTTGGLTLHAGVSDITPATMLPLFGRAGRRRAAHAIASRLEANCVLVRDGSAEPAALVTIDSLYPSAALTEAVAQACTARGLLFGPESIVIVASHTHNAPALDASKPNLGASSPAYLAFVADRISDCLVQLSQHSKAEITSLTSSHAECTASVFRRKALWGLDFARLWPKRRLVISPNSAELIDQTLKLALFKNDAGHPQAALWTWPCHAVSEPDALAIGADFPGMLREYIRESFADPTLPVLYFPGFSGDIRPASSARLPLHKSGRWIGLGARFAKAETKREKRLNRKLAAAFDRAKTEIHTVVSLAEAKFLHTQRSLALTEIREDAGDLPPLTCNDWQIGPLKIKAVSAEIASGYRNAVGGNDPLLFPTGCAQQVFGYIPTDQQIPEGGYEVEGFAPGFSVPGRFKNAIEAKIIELMNG